jgi:hypothetical protein
LRFFLIPGTYAVGVDSSEESHEHRGSYVVVKVLRLAFAALLALVVVFVTYSCQIAGPRLTAHQRGDHLRVEGRFLGEYSLGFERVRIEDPETRNVICEMFGRTTADVDLIAGPNTPQTMFGPESEVVFHAGPAACQLVPGKSYRLTAWGNNGWGNVRASSIVLRF